MRTFLHLAILLWLGSMVTQVFAQPQQRLRQDDHFWRKRIVNRISLVEKVNRPLVNRESTFASLNRSFTQDQGMVVSLINGLKQGKYVAYHPDDWKKTFNYEDISARMREFDQALIAEDDVWEEEEEGFESENNKESSSESEWEIQDDEWGSPFEEEPNQQEEEVEAPIDYAAYEEVIHMVEDWVFDRVQSRMVYQIDYFEVIWTDPTGTLPEKVLARFMWKDVQDQMEQTQWKTRFNDATARSIKEIFDLRIFHSILINVGGEPVASLSEAAYRRQKLIEFEHHLWNY